MHQETSLQDDHASTGNSRRHGEPLSSTNTAAAPTTASAPDAMVLEQDIGIHSGTDTTMEAAATATTTTTTVITANSSIGKTTTGSSKTSFANKPVETRRKELNELWHKLSYSSTTEHRRGGKLQPHQQAPSAAVVVEKQAEEEEKKQGDSDDGSNSSHRRRHNQPGATINTTMTTPADLHHQAQHPTTRQHLNHQQQQHQQHHQQQKNPNNVVNVSASLVLDLATESVEEKKHGEESIHLVVHEEHAEGSVHIVQMVSDTNTTTSVGGGGGESREMAIDRSVVLVDSLAHESLALNSLRLSGHQKNPQQQQQQHHQGSIALSSTRLQERKVMSKPIPSGPQQQQPPQQQQQQPLHQPTPPQDYLRHGTAPNTAGQPKKAGTSWWERVVVQRSSYVIEDLVDQYTADSLFLQSPALPVAFLDRIELEVSQLLGSGTYSNVSRVQQLQLLPNYLADHPQQHELRQAFVGASHQVQANEGGNPSLPPSTNAAASTGYAIKHLKSELLQNSKLFEAAAADLIMEAKFLSRMDHPNILKLRGMALGGTSTFAATGLFDSYFLVVDELQETLIQRIHRWKVQGSTDQYQPAMVLEKLKLAVQVASALAYLHHRRLVFRDLKPHNVGLKKLPYHQSIDTTTSSNGSIVSSNQSRSATGDSNIIQLFDFGFCRELPNPTPVGGATPLPTMVNAEATAAPPSDIVKTPGKTGTGDKSPQQYTGNICHDGDKDMEDVALDSPTDEAANDSPAAVIDEDQVFCMSGKGTLLYMASEVLSSSRCYNQKADVYSWSMVTYELLTLQKPFAVGSIEQHKKAICERGERPPLDHLRWLGSPVKDLLRNSWEADVNARWHMRDIKNKLDTIIADLETRKGFRKDGSFGSFGYNSSKSADGKESQSFNFCQGSGMTDMILDFTNAVQTRYGEYLFCSKDTTGASTAASTRTVADSEAAVAASGKSLEKTTAEKKQTGDSSEREVSLKSFQNTTEERSLRFDIPESEKEAVDTVKDKKPRGSKPKIPDANKKEKKTSVTKMPAKAQEDDFITTAKKAVWGGFARPHMSPAMRAPTTANASEQDFSERSLSMHSVRLQEAQNRRPTAWVAPRRLTSVHQPHNYGRTSYDEYGRARPYASRSLRAHSTRLDATIELENEDEDDTNKDMIENSLVIQSIRLGGNDQEHLEEIEEEAGDLISKGSSSLRSTVNGGSSVRSTGLQGGSSSLRSTSTPAPSSLHSIHTPVPSDCAGDKNNSLVAAGASGLEIPSEASPMTLDPNTAPVASRDVAIKNIISKHTGSNFIMDNEGEEGFGSIALTSTRIKTSPREEEEEDNSTPDESVVKDFVVATASI